MEFNRMDDQELRRWLYASPLDVDAIVEASDRFLKQEETEADEDAQHEFDVPVECPGCGHEFDTLIDINDYTS